ncbi:anti-sigma factor antagonist [Streptomyces sp. NPDC059355]|uniref:anti-sigma factor antagonist n=1 Tax=Streptomyces sp. NPDC059355 TaxID=3346811 RepID=UPI0036CBEEF0
MPSLAGYLGADATDRCTGAIGWALARGPGPAVLDLTGLMGWSADGQIAVAQAARRLADHGRRFELAAIPADGSLVLDGTARPWGPNVTEAAHRVSTNCRDLQLWRSQGVKRGARMLPAKERPGG